MDGIQSHSNKEGIAEWSKWITGISLFSASGCVSVLVAKGVGEKNIINIKLAIVFFLLTILIAWLIQLTIAMEAASDNREEMAATEPAEITSKEFLSRRKYGISPILKSLIVVEILVFAFSCFYLARWVWKFPSAAPVNRATVTQMHKKTQRPAGLCVQESDIAFRS